MSNEALAQAIRDSGLLDELMPADQLRHNEAIRQAIDQAGRLSPDTAAPLRTPITLSWGPSDVARRRTPQAGMLVLIWAHATTAPTSTCTVTVSMETRQQGATAVGTVTIPAGGRIGETTLAQPLPAGAYLSATVTTAGDASAVSTGVVIRGGG